MVFGSTQADADSLWNTRTVSDLTPTTAEADTTTWLEKARSIKIGSCWCGVRNPTSICLYHQNIAAALLAAAQSRRATPQPHISQLAKEAFLQVQKEVYGSTDADLKGFDEEIEKGAAVIERVFTNSDLYARGVEDAANAIDVLIELSREGIRRADKAQNSEDVFALIAGRDALCEAHKKVAAIRPSLVPNEAEKEGG